MQIYGLGNHLSSVILALTTFATPYAIFIFSQYGKSIPMELDESARIDGANPWQIYFRIYLPLMAPALVAVGTYALLLAWNEYLYNFLLLSTPESMTVAVALAQFLNSDESPWNFMMATAIIYALPPIILYYGFRRYMAAGLTMGGVKGSRTAAGMAVHWTDSVTIMAGRGDQSGRVADREARNSSGRSRS